ncbi:hypothetical protein ABPG75_010440 [Micractinium tetrahymenae]
MKRHSPLQLVLWLGVALVAHILVALFGVLNRWLQTPPTPPLPALRSALMVSLLALASVAVVDASSRAAGWLLRWQRQRRRRQGPALGGQGGTPPQQQQQHSQQQYPQQLQGPPQQPRPATLEPTASAPFGRWDSVTVRQPGEALPPPRPELALQRGLSSRVRDLQHGQPRLVRLAALSVITLTFATAYLCQVIAPGFVDPAMIQLVMIWTVIGVAFVQRVLLRHRLPLIIWPCSVVMLGGACMILVPTVGKGSGAGLTGWRGWLGFGLSLLSLISTVFYFISLQVSRSMGFATLQLQYLFLLFCILLLLPLSLAVDGTDWTSQFRGWNAHD